MSDIPFIDYLLRNQESSANIIKLIINKFGCRAGDGTGEVFQNQRRHGYVKSCRRSDSPSRSSVHSAWVLCPWMPSSTSPKMPCLCSLDTFPLSSRRMTLRARRKVKMGWSHSRGKRGFSWRSIWSWHDYLGSMSPSLWSWMTGRSCPGCSRSTVC